MTKAEIARDIRQRLSLYLVDDSAIEPHGVAIYTLSDPRDIRAVRYVGQTTAPRRRFLQHLNTARLWSPEEIPWWVESPKLRPLYEWIRQLHRDDFRLPMMIVTTWVEASDARRVERERIYACLADRLPLLNVENELLGPQLLLPSEPCVRL